MDVGRRRLTARAKLIMVLYAVAFGALPFAHHDLLCHVRSTTHCDVCHVGTSAEDSGAHPGLAQVHLQDAGGACDTLTPFVSSAVVVRSSGRSPPPILSL